jgi:predicted enzyme related to lactoylglutathione lyase
MSKSNRREILQFGSASLALPIFAALQSGCAQRDDASDHTAKLTQKNEPKNTNQASTKETQMKVQYLEFVSPDADAVCKTYAEIYGVKFGEPQPGLGNARTATLPDGSVLGVRAPLRPDETPVVRPYVLVEDIEAAVEKAKEAGAEIAVPPMELPGHGTCAIFIHGGIEHGLWQQNG